MSAQSALGGLSSQCQSSLTSLVTSDFATCSNLLGLVSVASSSGSIVSSLDSYISDLCTSATCSQSTLNNASSTVSNGCQSDIASGSSIPVALNTLINNYADVRGLLCTKYTSNNTYCVTDVLGAVQNSTGTQLSLSTVSSLISGNDYASFLNSIPKSAYCTDCGHAITTEALKIVQNVSASNVDSVKNAASQQCGSSFVDGSLPSGISTSGSSGTASSSSTTGAASPSFNLNSKTLAIIGTISAVIAGVSITM